LVIGIGDHDRAVFYTGGTTRAFLLYNVSGLLDQGYLEVSCLTFYTVNFGIGEDLDIGMPADLDQFGREYSHGAVIGGIGLVKLGHMAANGRRFLNEVNPKTSSGKIEGGLNAADPSPDNHDVSKIAFCKTSTKLPDFLYWQ
jgi:hypothetical protein